MENMEEYEVKILKIYNKVANKNALRKRDFFSFKKEVTQIYKDNKCPNTLLLNSYSKRSANCELAEKLFYGKEQKDARFSCSRCCTSFLSCVEGFLLRNEVLKIKESNMEVL